MTVILFFTDNSQTTIITEFVINPICLSLENKISLKSLEPILIILSFSFLFLRELPETSSLDKLKSCEIF